MKHKNFLIYFLALIPACLLRDFTPDNELRYLSIADEAIRNGSLFAFFNHGEIYADKPPLYIWIVMLGKLLFGHHNGLYLGMFSILPGLVILYVMDKWVSDVMDAKHRLLSQSLLISTAYFIASMAVLRMDMLMNMFIVLALNSFYNIYAGQSKKRDAWLFPIYVFLALFTKGPVGILVPLLSVFVFLWIKKELKTFGRYWGWLTWAVLLACCALWFGMVYVEGGADYLNNLLFHQTMDRAVDAFHHKEPFYYYFVSIWYILAPWALLYIGVIVFAIRKKAFTTDLEKFFATVVAVTIAMLSLFSSKLDIYLLPTIAFFCYLAVLLLPKLSIPKWIDWFIGIPLAIFALAVPVALGLTVAGKVEIPSSVFVYLAMAILFGASLFALFQVWKKKNGYRAVRVFSTGLLATAFVGAFVIPSINDSVGYGKLSEIGQMLARENNSTSFYNYKVRRGENMDVYLGTSPTELSDNDLEHLDSIKGVLFFRVSQLEENKRLSEKIQGKFPITKGKYAVVYIE
ncbi:MAG: hypothetical protein LBS52_02790 [Dysgonamonadaceae bacterium]|jgi:4-amino-4-deoxy-L-arabinose transferase-like glycosyltransferase|nr:hypothetical protein [Dysgonamonadaceae bacterium]